MTSANDVREAALRLIDTPTFTFYSIRSFAPFTLGYARDLSNGDYYVYEFDGQLPTAFRPVAGPFSTDEHAIRWIEKVCDWRSPL